MTQTAWTMPRKKVFGVPLQKDMQKAEDGSYLLIRGYFTSDNRDEIGDVITRAATEAALPKYRAWGNIRYMHMPRPVAKVTRIGEEDGLEWNEVEIKVIDPQAIFEVENGLLQALSVGILVNFEDVEMSEDGGWVINNYQLAEISLVDHPANYDAFLKDIPTTKDEVRLLAREYGIDFVARSYSALKETSMPENDETIVEQPVDKDATETAPEETPVEEPETTKSEPCRQDGESEDDCVSRKVPEILQENPEMSQDQAVAMATEMCAKACGEDEAPEAEDTAEDELGVENAEPENQEEVAETTLEDSINQLNATIQAFIQALGEFMEGLKANTEAPQAEEQAIDASTSETPAEDETPEDETGSAVNRKGALPETTLPTAEPQPEVPAPIVEVKSLRDALRNRFIK